MVQPFFWIGVAPAAGFGRLNLVWWRGCFAGVFAEFVVQRGGKSWCFCGELRGKRGRKMVTFRGLKNRTGF
jgi:hypothetical protein